MNERATVLLDMLNRSLRETWPRDFGEHDERMPSTLQTELGRALRVLVRLRLFSLWVVLVVTGIFAVFEPVPWKLATCVAALLFHGASTLHDLRQPLPEEVLPQRFERVLRVTLIVFTAVIVVSGGIESPVIISYVPVASLLAVAVGQVRPFLQALIWPLVVVWAMALGRYVGWIPYLVPEMFHGPAVPDALIIHTVGTAIVISLAMIVGGLIALMIRQALDQAVLMTAQARSQALNAMRERNQTLIQLTEAVSHELKNPLASIRGLSALAARRAEPGGKDARQLEVMVGEIDRMGAVLDELLVFSRPFRALEMASVQVEALLDDVVVLTEGLASERGVSVSAEAAPGLSVRCDPKRVRQLLLNLMQNALDATPRGGQVRLLGAGAAGGGVSLEVLDTGPGLSDGVRGRLFTRGVTDKVAGSGLGLTIARSIAERHGGSLTLSDRPEGGCRAALSLPAEGAYPQLKEPV